MTITAEQARAFLAGITPGPWRVSLTDETVVVSDDILVRVDGDYDDFGIAPIMSATATAIAAVPDMLATIVAQAERIAELEARENEWRSAFWVADQFAVAIHDDAGKFYSIRAPDFNRMSDLYRRDISAARAALNGERT